MLTQTTIIEIKVEETENYQMTVDEKSDVNFSVDSEIAIKPIPSNYGLITWDGNVLTVS